MVFFKRAPGVGQSSEAPDEREQVVRLHPGELLPLSRLTIVVVFNPDGQRIVSGSSDNSGREGPVPAGRRGDLPARPQGWHEHQGRVRRSEIQGDHGHGGSRWRARVAAKDANNYVVRANALENNVVLYKTVGGVRSSLDIVGQKGGYGVKAPVAANQWHTLRVEFAGTRFKVIFNGKPLFEVEDSTFVDPGMIGLWTKADSITVFDGLTYGEKK